MLVQVKAQVINVQHILQVERLGIYTRTVQLTHIGRHLGSSKNLHAL